MKTVYINGKFVGQSVTGAQRFALGVLSGLDLLMNDSTHPDGLEFILVHPTSVAERLPSLKNIKTLALPGRSSHAWEQIVLPLRLMGRTLLNLSGSGPAFKLGQFVTIFDAAIFDYPRAYSWKFRAWYRFMFNCQSRLCRGIITISRFSRSRVSQALGLKSSDVGVVPCGIDHIQSMKPDDSIFSDFPITRQRYILAVGSMNPTKNFPRLATSFLASAIDRDVKLVVVGAANEAVFNSTEIAKDDRVVRASHVDDRQLLALYSNALAFAFPSLYEGFGIPPLEAMHCGCPVIAANAASIPEICGDAALYFEPEDEQSIRAAIEEIVRNAPLREQMRVNGRLQSSQYRWRQSAEILYRYLANHLEPRTTSA